VRITVFPFGNTDGRVLKLLLDRLPAAFDADVRVQAGIDEPLDAYDPRRRQWSAAPFLRDAHAFGGDKVLGVTEVDLFGGGLNFVFGQAEVGGKSAVISLARLGPTDHADFAERVVKEAVHELGHTFGLGHCDDSRCVMTFSNSLQDTDAKSAALCRECAVELRQGMGSGSGD
jgi:archaemetzincin